MISEIQNSSEIYRRNYYQRKMSKSTWAAVWYSTNSQIQKCNRCTPRKTNILSSYWTVKNILIMLHRQLHTISNHSADRITSDLGNSSELGISS